MSNAEQNLSVDIKEDFKRNVEKSWEEKEGHDLVLGIGF